MKILSFLEKLRGHKADGDTWFLWVALVVLVIAGKTVILTVWLDPDSIGLLREILFQQGY